MITFAETDMCHDIEMDGEKKVKTDLILYFLLLIYIICVFFYVFWYIVIFDLGINWTIRIYKI